jgi:hypothetical protein
MPAQRTTRTSTKPASTPRAKAGAATDATIRKVIQQEQAKDNRQTTTKATSTRSTGNGRAPARRKPADAPFRAVTLVTETYLDIEGLKEDFDLASCPRCAALIPSGDKAQAAHKGFHEQIDGLDQRA